jgi:hypothetical protein
LDLIQQWTSQELINLAEGVRSTVCGARDADLHDGAGIRPSVAADSGDMTDGARSLHSRQRLDHSVDEAPTEYLRMHADGFHQDR